MKVTVTQAAEALATLAVLGKESTRHTSDGRAAPTVNPVPGQARRLRTAEELGRRVRQLRQERAWSVKRLADRAGVSARTVLALERGRRVGPETIERVAAALHVSPVALRQAHPFEPASAHSTDAVGAFKLERRPKDLPAGIAVLAFVDDDTLTFRVLDREERDALKSQFRRTGLTAAEEEQLTRGGASAAELAMGPVLWAEVSRASDQEYQAMLTGSLSVEQAARRLGVGASRIRQRLLARTLYGIKSGGDWRIPSFQFLPAGRLVPGIDKVLPVLPPDLSPLAAYRWFTSPNPDLCTRDARERALTPLDWLRLGHSPETAAVLAADL